MTMHVTLCHIIDRKRNRILLKLASRGIGKGKWNALGGKVEKGETSRQNAAREAFEESGLRVRNLFYHSQMRIFTKGKKPDFIIHLFSTSSFGGKLHSTDEGKVRWFDIGRIPFERMWDEDKYWMAAMLQRKQFEAEFYYDGSYSNVIKAVIKIRK